jgi:hypothetical protein
VAEHDREHSRFRKIVARSDDTKPVLADEFTDARYKRTGLSPGFRGGVTMNVTPRFVARFGYGYYQRYDDLGGSQAIEAGIGLRLKR